MLREIMIVFKYKNCITLTIRRIYISFVSMVYNAKSIYKMIYIENIYIGCTIFKMYLYIHYK